MFLRISIKWIIIFSMVLCMFVGCSDLQMDSKKDNDDIFGEAPDLFEKYKEVSLPYTEEWINKAAKSNSKKYLLTVYKRTYKDIFSRAITYREDGVNQIFADGYRLLTDKNGVLSIREKMRELGFDQEGISQSDIMKQSLKKAQEMHEQGIPDQEIKKYACVINAIQFILDEDHYFEEMIDEHVRDDLDKPEELIYAIVAFAKDVVNKIQEHLLSKVTQSVTSEKHYRHYQ